MVDGTPMPVMKDERPDPFNNFIVVDGKVTTVTKR